MLTFTTLWANSTDDNWRHFFYFLFLPESRLWHSMRDNLHAISNSVHFHTLKKRYYLFYIKHLLNLYLIMVSNVKERNSCCWKCTEMSHKTTPRAFSSQLWRGAWKIKSYNINYRRHRMDMTQVCKIKHNIDDIQMDGLFEFSDSQTRDHIKKLKIKKTPKNLEP